MKDWRVEKDEWADVELDNMGRPAPGQEETARQLEEIKGMMADCLSAMEVSRLGYVEEERLYRLARAAVRDFKDASEKYLTDARDYLETARRGNPEHGLPDAPDPGPAVALGEKVQKAIPALLKRGHTASVATWREHEFALRCDRTMGYYLEQPGRYPEICSVIIAAGPDAARKAENEARESARRAWIDGDREVRRVRLAIEAIQKAAARVALGRLQTVDAITASETPVEYRGILILDESGWDDEGRRYIRRPEREIDVILGVGQNGRWSLGVPHAEWNPPARGVNVLDVRVVGLIDGNLRVVVEYGDDGMPYYTREMVFLGGGPSHVTRGEREPDKTVTVIVREAVRPAGMP